VRIENNYIGLGSDGATLIPNKDGIQYSVIAQPIKLVNNVISGNTRTGIRMSNTSNQVIIGNKIGVLPDGVTSAGNGSHGIILHTNSHDNRLGGELAGEGNIIANNGGDGVLIGSDPSSGFAAEAGVGNSVIGNLIFGNSGLAIDLGPNNGTTANDANDVDVGPNNLQNSPAISLASTVGDAILLRGTFNSTLGNYRIDFYSGSLAGQAQKYLGTLLDSLVDTTTLEFALIFDTEVTAGQFVAAIATNLDTGDSSELSASLTVL
jgi:parallel beta-helix repeat protein